MLLPVLAQEQKKNIYTIERAVRTALELNTQLNSQRFEIDKAEAQVSEAWGTAMPTLNLTANYVHYIDKPVIVVQGLPFPGVPAGGTVEMSFTPDNTYQTSLQLTQILFNSAVITGISTSAVYSETARQLFLAKQLEIVTSVRKAFNQALLAREAKKLMLDNLKNAEGNVRNVQVMQKQGIVSEYDMIRAEVAVENLKPIVLQAENNYLLALNAVRAAMGLRDGEGFDIEGELSVHLLDQSFLDSAQAMVLVSNISLKALGLQRKITDAMVDIQRSSYIPTIAAFANFQYQAQKYDKVISLGDFRYNSMVGLNFSVNLFQGLQTNAKVEQAKLDVRKVDEMIRGTEINLGLAVQSFVNQIRQAQKRIEGQDRTVAQAERGHVLATTRFTAGSGTQLEVNDAQLALTQAKVNRMQAMYDYMVATAELENLLGLLPPYARSPQGKNEGTTSKERGLQ
jgi:outer membrane protein TolC